MRLATCTGTIGLMMAASAAAGTVLINEARINEVGTDNNEYFELEGTPGESIGNLTYLVLGDNSDPANPTPDGYVECVVSLTGHAINGAGFFVAAEPTFALPGGIVDLTLAGTNPLNFENTDNVTHMLVADFTGLLGDDLDVDDDGVLDVTPWSAVVDDFALIDQNFPAGNHVYSANLIGPDGTYHPGHVYRCTPAAAWLVGDFSAGVDDTPGATNPICDIDTDGDGIPDYLDNCPFHYNSGQEDCDNDGMGDVCAIAEGYSQDCDESGVPDECENLPDPNGNGVPEVCEITPPTGLFINELRIDEIGADIDEFFELKGDASTSLHQLRYLVIGDALDGDSGVIEAVVNLNNKAVGADGLFLAAEDTFTLASILEIDLLLGSDLNELNFENSDNVTHVLVANFFGTINQDLDSDDDGVLDDTPWLATIDAVGLLESDTIPPTNTEWAYGEALGFANVGPDGAYVPGLAYRCVPNALWTVGLFDPPGQEDTPAAENLPCGVPPCPEDLNGDGNVNVLDLLELLAAWGAAGGPEDLNGDGIVDVLDLLQLLGAWGPCP